MGSLERGLDPLSQCECLCQNLLHHCASADVFITSLDTTWLAGTTMQGERWVAWVDKDWEPARYTDLSWLHDIFLHTG